MEVFQAAYNGISEFINEVSGAIIAFIFNWMLIQRAGVEGVAAITVVNYMLMTGFMMFFCHRGHKSGNDFSKLWSSKCTAH